MTTCKAFVLAVILALCTGVSRGQCPAKCNCNGTAVYCREQQLSTIPLSLPDASLLDLSHNMLASLPDDAFKGYPNLTKLWLDGNRLRSISRASFRGLAKLRVLYLFSNDLESMDDGVFKEMPDLNELKTCFRSNCFHKNHYCMGDKRWQRRMVMFKSIGSDIKTKKGRIHHPLRECLGND